MQPRSFAPVPLLLMLAACIAPGGLTGRASDEWTRSYPLTPGGEVSIVNGNGRIEIEGVDGDKVDVRAERVARAATDAAAREMLPRISIKENVRPDRVAIETERLGGILIAVSIEVRYRVLVPKAALVRARTSNGEIAVDALGGRLVATTANGGITGRNLGGGVEARVINGPVTIDIRLVGTDPIDLRTVNGTVQLTLPETARANVSANCSNCAITVSDFTLDLMGEQSRRRVRGRINGGGTPIDLATTNGSIRIGRRPS